jgi:hypothetical protein
LIISQCARNSVQPTCSAEQFGIRSLNEVQTLLASQELSSSFAIRHRGGISPVSLGISILDCLLSSSCYTTLDLLLSSIPTDFRHRIIREFAAFPADVGRAPFAGALALPRVGTSPMAASSTRPDAGPSLEMQDVAQIMAFKDEVLAGPQRR